jgi:uncharacterized protein YbjT (DUF2867 family)
MERVLVAGASGYLGSKIAHKAKSQGYNVKVLLRKKEQVEKFNFNDFEYHIGSATDEASLDGLCKDVDYVISSLGITRQKDGLTYDQVDFGANKNILEEAEKREVKKFIYIGVFNGEKLKHTKLVGAKEKFVSQLKESSLNYSVIRPNGFFSDMEDFYKMAEGGRAYLFGDGNQKINPISGDDLAKFTIGAISKSDKDLPVGGPNLYTLKELAELAFNALGKKPKIVLLSDGLRKFTLWILPKVTPLSFYGPIQFFLSAFGLSLESPKYGKDSLEEHFNNIAR